MNNSSHTYTVKYSNNMDLFLNTAQCKTGECKRAAFEEHNFMNDTLQRILWYGHKGVMYDHALCQCTLLLSGIEQLVSEST